MANYVDIATAQFENTNSLRNYPFSECSSLVDDTGRRLPQNVVADLHMYVPHDGSSEPPVVRMTSVHLSQSMVSLCFVSGQASGQGSKGALSVTVSASVLKPYVPYRMEKLAGFYDIGGIVTFGEMELPGYPETYRFDPKGDNAIVHPCCVAAARPAGLRRIVDRVSGESISGEVNIGFSGFVKTEKSGKSFRLSLEDGAAESLMPQCEGLKKGAGGVCGATPITSINGIRPDEEGNIVLWFH